MTTEAEGLTAPVYRWSPEEVPPNVDIARWNLEWLTGPEVVATVPGIHTGVGETLSRTLHGPGWAFTTRHLMTIPARHAARLLAGALDNPLLSVYGRRLAEVWLHRSQLARPTHPADLGELMDKEPADLRLARETLERFYLRA